MKGDDYEVRLSQWRKRAQVAIAQAASAERAAERALVEADAKLGGVDFCVHCDAGPLPVRNMHLVTRRMNPDVQFDPDQLMAGESADDAKFRVRACSSCFRERYLAKD